MLKKRNEKFWNTKHPGIETKVSEMKKKKKNQKQTNKNIVWLMGNWTLLRAGEVNNYPKWNKMNKLMGKENLEN